MFWRRPAPSLLVIFAGAALVLLTMQSARSVSGTSAAPRHPRSLLFGPLASPITEALNGHARLTVLFFPGVGQCKAQELAAIRALRKIGREAPGVLILTVLPTSLAATARFGEEPPGKVVRMGAERFGAEARIAPTPRIEVWSGSGQLLLMRSLPSNANEGEIHEQILWTRSFTAPI